VLQALLAGVVGGFPTFTLFLSRCSTASLFASVDPEPVHGLYRTSSFDSDEAKKVKEDEDEGDDEEDAVPRRHIHLDFSLAGGPFYAGEFGSTYRNFGAAPGDSFDAGYNPAGPSGGVRGVVAALEMAQLGRLVEIT